MQAVQSAWGDQINDKHTIEVWISEEAAYNNSTNVNKQNCVCSNKQAMGSAQNIYIEKWKYIHGVFVIEG